MKTGMSLVQMAETLMAQAEQKRDYVAPTGSLTMSPDAKRVAIGTAAEGALTRHAERQLAAKLEIPVAFYDRLRDRHPDLLSNTVNTLFQREPQKVMVRTLNDSVRAFVSDRFRPLDNFDLFQAIAPELINMGARVESCELTETKLYIKALAPWLDRELAMPPGLQMGVGNNIFTRKVIGAITISNSEVGAGALSISPAIFERQCTNLAVFKSDGYGKLHVGKALGGDDVQQYLSDETKRLSDAAVWAQARDVVKATLDGRVIDQIIAKMEAARGDVIEANPTGVVEVFAKRNRFTEEEKGDLLKHLVGSGEMTRYGLQWAVTRMANDAADYDRASELERLGGQVIELSKNEWKEIVKAAA
jgi:hypothetical protein